MARRLEYRAGFAKGPAAVRWLEAYLRSSGLEEPLLQLIKTRASQINGCAYCIDMHTKDARSAGETEQRLYALSTWRETAFFTERERAALAWTEAVTRIAEDRIADAIYEGARQHFEEKELVDLTVAVIAITAGIGLPSHFKPHRESISRRENERPERKSMKWRR